MDDSPKKILKGRGAQINTVNPFAKYIPSHEVEDYFDEDEPGVKTKIIQTHAKTIVNEVPSEDIGMPYSLNPYQGCEHGCVYCYARNTHPYWGFSAGVDFESVIMVKSNATELLEQKLKSKSWQGEPIMMAGNTDCYQPIEKKLKITRSLLEVFWKYKHPVGIITKNRLLLRDMDILSKLNEHRLLKVAVSLNTLDDGLRQKLEPRASSVSTRLDLIEQLVGHDIPVNVMMAPIIPSINDHEILPLMKKLGDIGVTSAHYIVVRLNADVAQIFENWLHVHFKDRAERVMHQIADIHGGQVNDSRVGTRMKGEGNIAKMIKSQYELGKSRYFKVAKPFEYDLTLYQQIKNPQLKLF